MIFNVFMYTAIFFTVLVLIVLVAGWIEKNWDWFSVILFVVIIPVAVVAGIIFCFLDAGEIPMIFGG